MRRLVGLGGLVSLGGLVGVAAHRATSTEYPWSRPGATASTILEDPQWPADFPITSEHLKRLDETVDTSFYAQPRMVHHIDDEARRALQAHYRAMLPRGGNPSPSPNPKPDPIPNPGPITLNLRCGPRSDVVVDVSPGGGRRRASGGRLLRTRGGTRHEPSP